MKKIVKNILLVFMIIYTILNILLCMLSKVSVNIAENANNIILNGNRYEDGNIVFEENLDSEISEMKSEYGEDTPVLLIKYIDGYLSGTTELLEREITVLIISIILGIAIGAVISSTKKYKIKELLYFIIIGLVSNLALTTYMCIAGVFNNEYVNFIDLFIYNIQDYSLYYTIIYLLIYVYRYYIDKKTTKKINEELKNKQK